MVFLIKEPQNDDDADITGTVVMLLDKKRADGTETQGTTIAPVATTGDAGDNSKNSDGLKFNKKGIILNPQPHDDPNDPLNWPIWRRDIALLVIGLFSFICGGLTPVLAPVMGTLEKDFDKPLHTLTFLVGGFMFAMGVGSFFLAPTAILYGKRLVYLVGQLLLIGGFFWGANAKSFGSLMGARVLMGIGAGPAESLPSATIAEIFFAHERAYRLGIYTLLLLGGKNLVPLVSGFVAQSLGWHWIFWLLAIITGSLSLGTFVFIHETWWDRTPIPDKRSRMESEAAARARVKLNRPSWDGTHSLSGAIQPVSSSSDSIQTVVSKKEPSESEASSDTPSGPSDRRPFLRNLAVYTGRKSDSPWWKVALRPFVLYAYPHILFSTFLYGSSVVWLSVIAETISTIFTAEPYMFPRTSVGLLYVGTFTGGCLGSAVAGKISDFLVAWMSARNHGIYEPEFRLLMVIPVMIAVTIGLMGFGWSTFDKDAWIVPAIFLGILGFGTSLASTVAITFAVDSYKMFAAEALVSLNVAKNTMGLAFSIFVPYFFAASGGKISYVVYGCVQIGISLFAIPLYRYGKVIRQYRDKHNPVRHFYG